MRILGTEFVHLASPDYAREFLSQADTFRKVILTDRMGSFNLATKFLGAANVVFSNGDIWRRHRRISNPAFHKSWNTDVFGSVTTTLCGLLDRLNMDDFERENGVDIHDLVQRFVPEWKHDVDWLRVRQQILTCSRTILLD
ncbi:hypothetical protein BC936DRAFT_139940 [Jimgerdemannia flammicorona]|uniref:Cytochrome P450 n=1 Tax=Jimgerdemannia flammicorona TaxID=994334 RepID=A0A433B8Z0_9FUNG|nr:hypothetical protein BC936DRAFT_139940 [Jimgerdemannia flammicorona]